MRRVIFDPVDFIRRDGHRRNQVPLLVSQAFDRVEVGGAGGGNGAKDDSHQRGNDNGDDRREARNRDAILGKVTDGKRDRQSDEKAEHTADEGDK